MRQGCHFEASLILQAVSWYLRYSLSYRDIEELFRERGLAVDHSTLNRWVLAYAPLIERWLCTFTQLSRELFKISMRYRFVQFANPRHPACQPSPPPQKPCCT